MKIANQQAKKKLMENYKRIARETGLKLDDETLEYIVTGKDLVRLLSDPALYGCRVRGVGILGLIF